MHFGPFIFIIIHLVYIIIMSTACYKKMAYLYGKMTTFFKTEKLVRRMILIYISANVFHLWLNRKQ